MRSRRLLGTCGLLPFVLIVALFFLWGVANNLNDVLIAHFKKLFTLSDFQAGLVQSAFYLGYFCLAIPAALFMRAYGYRAAVLMGLISLGLLALGLDLPPLLRLRLLLDFLPEPGFVE